MALLDRGELGWQGALQLQGLRDGNCRGKQGSSQHERMHTHKRKLTNTCARACTHTHTPPPTYTLAPTATPIHHTSSSRNNHIVAHLMRSDLLGPLLALRLMMLRSDSLLAPRLLFRLLDRYTKMQKSRFYGICKVNTDKVRSVHVSKVSRGCAQCEGSVLMQDKVMLMCVCCEQRV